MYICLYDTCADINLSLYVCWDEFWRTSRRSFKGILSYSTSVLTRLWVNGNILGANADDGHYKGLINLMEIVNVIWRLYKTRRDLTPFRDICWYSG
jgi:hypothetical protein